MCIYKLSRMNVQTINMVVTRFASPAPAPARSRRIPIQEQQRHTRAYQKHEQEKPSIPCTPLGLDQLDIRLPDTPNRLICILIQPFNRLRLTRQMGDQRRLQLGDLEQAAFGVEHGIECRLHGFEQVGVFRRELLDLGVGEVECGVGGEWVRVCVCCSCCG